MLNSMSVIFEYAHSEDGWTTGKQGQDMSFSPRKDTVVSAGWEEMDQGKQVKKGK